MVLMVLTNQPLLFDEVYSRFEKQQYRFTLFQNVAETGLGQQKQELRNQHCLNLYEGNTSERLRFPRFVTVVVDGIQALAEQ
jgi:hypothetical protein